MTKERILYLLIFLGVGACMWALVSWTIDRDSKTAATAAAKIALSTTRKIEKHDHKASTKAQVAACRRGNDLRRKINTQGKVITGFMQLAINAAEHRAHVDKGAAQRLDLHNAMLYKQQRAAFRAVKLVPCVKAVSKVANEKTAFSTTKAAQAVVRLADTLVAAIR